MLVGHVELEVGDRLDHVVASDAERVAHSVFVGDAEVGGLPREERHRDVGREHRHLVAEQLHLVRGGAHDERDRGKR